MHGHPRTQAAEPGPPRSMAPQTQWPVAVVPQGAGCAQSATQRPQSWEEPGGLVRGGGNRPPVAASGQHPAATALPTSVPVCTSESPWEAESVLLGDQPDRRPPYRLSSQRLPGPLFCLSHLLLC